MVAQRYVEVKTTECGISTSFFISANEALFSAEHPDSYFLYRLFDYNDVYNSARMFILQGDIRRALRLTATQYRADMIIPG